MIHDPDAPADPEDPHGSAGPTDPAADGVDGADVHGVDADGDDGVEGEPDERRYPSTIGGACYLVVLAVGAAAVVVAALGDWRLGVRLLAGALGGAAAARLVLPQRDAGMLAVRHRLLDVTLLVAVGVALWVLAGDVPEQPGPGPG